MTARTPLLGLQAAIYDALNGNVSADVYDNVPEGASYPYVGIGEAVETPRNWHGGFGRNSVVTLHVWSKTRGFKEALDIADEILQLLDHQPLSVDDQHVVSVRYEFSQTLRDPDPEIRHVPVRFRVTTEQS